MRRLIALTCCLFLLAGCANVTKPRNSATPALDASKGYRSELALPPKQDDVFLMLSFSGGGTRAAAFSYGVLEELRDTPIQKNGETHRLLDEVDFISSVSGGSFTAAYYGLYGDDTFKTYEDRFLKQSIQGTLIRQLLNPIYWIKSLFSGIDRTEMSIDYYDTYIFRGATFADMPHGTRPFIEINATDLGAGSRFSFTQRYFDLLCSDIDEFPVAAAVTASSAVPILFPSVVLENHASDCDINNTRIGQLLDKWDNSIENVAREELKKSLLSYRDEQQRPYIHLVDGGITDNLGMRAVFERLQTLGYKPGSANDPFAAYAHVAFILVNAETRPRKTIDDTAEKPGISQTIDSVSSTQIRRFNIETRHLLERGIAELNALETNAGRPPKFKLIEISFETVASRKRKDYLNSLPTTLELSSDQVDELIATARDQMRASAEFQALLESLNTP